MHIGDWLARREMLTPDRVALIDSIEDARPITWRDWNRNANRAAHLLRALGVGRGDRVASLAMNCVELLDLFFACGKLGAIYQPLNWRLTAGELSALIRDAEPRVLVYGPDFSAQVRALEPHRREVRFVALSEATRVDADDARFSDRAALPETSPGALELSLEDPWLLCYTGGSTGLPKGAILTHGNITWNAVNTAASWGLGPDDVTFLNAPLFHTGGLNVLTTPFVHIGATSLVCRGFDVDQVFHLIQNGGVTVFFGVPTMFIAMQQHPRWGQVDFSRVRWIISGGAPCPQPVFEAFRARGVEFRTGYGLTEAGPNNFWLPRAEVWRRPGAVGVPLFHIDAKVVDGEGRECGPDEVGELLLRGPHVFAGYWRRPEETARTLEGGWLHTGDLARRDGDGFFYIAGRLKDLIISGGENVYPAEVESVMAGHPAVAEVALIGVPDPKWGEVGRAIVAVRPDAQLEADDLLAWCRERLARYKVPATVVFVESLPKTGAGKVDRQALQAKYGSAVISE